MSQISNSPHSNAPSHLNVPSHSNAQAGFAHERLAIVDPLSGAQPLYSEDGTVALAANGEIYNHKKLRAQYFADKTFATASDCEVCFR